MTRPSKQKPGETRERIFAFVRQRLLQGQPPSVREVQQAFNFRAVQSAQEHLEGLVKEGRLQRAEGQARGYRLSDAVPRNPLWIPLLGRVQAGTLTTAVEQLEGYLPLEARRGLGEGSDLFALRVRGESMNGAGILAGDLVVVRRQATAHSGEIVVALVDDEATVKRLHLAHGRVELRPENPNFAPLVIRPPHELTLLGRVIELRRYLDPSGAPLRDSQA